MTPTLESLGIDRMTVPERIALARAIWDSVTAETESAPQEPDEVEALARMIRDHDLNRDEIVRLLQVLRDYEPTVQKQELEEELRCILAARELAARPKLTNEVVDRARGAFASGRVPFVPQDMD